MQVNTIDTPPLPVHWCLASFLQKHCYTCEDKPATCFPWKVLVWFLSTSHDIYDLSLFLLNYFVQKSFFIPCHNWHQWVLSCFLVSGHLPGQASFHHIQNYHSYSVNISDVCLKYCWVMHNNPIISWLFKMAFPATFVYSVELHYILGPGSWDSITALSLRISTPLVTLSWYQHQYVLPSLLSII